MSSQVQIKNVKCKVDTLELAKIGYKLYDFVVSSCNTYMIFADFNLKAFDYRDTRYA